MLPRPLVIRLAAILGLQDDAFLVGGQALNIWAERYAHRPELTEFGPFVSKDVDYFGRTKAAEKLARALDGTLKLPGIDDVTPNTAIVTAEVDGHRLEVDFLDNVLGVEPKSLKKLAVEISVPVELDGQQGSLLIPVMHPLHCMQSRIANVVQLDRRDLRAERQLQASPIVLDAYVEEMLEKGHVKEVIVTVRALISYLRSDPDARKVHHMLRFDPLSTLERLSGDSRLDERYRAKTLRPMISRLRRIRTRMS